MRGLTCAFLALAITINLVDSLPTQSGMEVADTAPDQMYGLFARFSAACPQGQVKVMQGQAVPTCVRHSLPELSLIEEPEDKFELPELTEAQAKVAVHDAAARGYQITKLLQHQGKTNAAFMVARMASSVAQGGTKNRKWEIKGLHAVITRLNDESSPIAVQLEPMLRTLRGEKPNWMSEVNMFFPTTGMKTKDVKVASAPDSSEKSIKKTTQEVAAAQKRLNQVEHKQAPGAFVAADAKVEHPQKKKVQKPLVHQKPVQMVAVTQKKLDEATTTDAEVTKQYRAQLLKVKQEIQDLKAGRKHILKNREEVPVKGEGSDEEINAAENAVKQAKNQAQKTVSNARKQRIKDLKKELNEHYKKAEDNLKDKLLAAKQQAQRVSKVKQQHKKVASSAVNHIQQATNAALKASAAKIAATTKEYGVEPDSYAKAAYAKATSQAQRLAAEAAKDLQKAISIATDSVLNAGSELGDKHKKKKQQIYKKAESMEAGWKEKAKKKKAQAQVQDKLGAKTKKEKNDKAEAVKRTAMEIANKKTTKALKQKLKKQEAEQAAQQNAKAVATAAAAVKSAVAQKAAVVKKTQQENKKVEEDKKVAQPKSKAAKVAAGKASQKLKEQKKKQQKKDKEQQKEDKEQQKKEQQKDVGSSPSTDSEILQTSGSAYSILFVVLGTLFVLFGYRFYMPMLFFGGFISFVYITDFLCWYNHFSHSDSIWLVPIVGIIMGVLCMFVYRLGCFTLGAAWGAVNALLLNGILFGRVMHDNISLQVIMPLSMILFGIICSMYHHHSPLDNECGLRKMLIFSKTSFIGSYIFLRGCGHIIGDYPFELDLVQGEIPSSYDYYLVGTIFLALFGILLQMRFTHKGDCGLLENVTAEEQKPLVQSTPNGSGSGSGSGCTTQKSTRQADPLQPRGPPAVPKNSKGGVCCR